MSVTLWSHNQLTSSSAKADDPSTPRYSMSSRPSRRTGCLAFAGMTGRQMTSPDLPAELKAALDGKLRGFAQRRCRPLRINLENLPRWRRLRRHPVGDRRAGLCAGADARDLCRGHGQPERAGRDQAGLRADKPARCRGRTGHCDLGRRRSLPVAAGFRAARRQRGAAHAGARPRHRQLSPARRQLRTRRSPRRAGESGCGRPCRGELHDRRSSVLPNSARSPS